MTNIPKESGFFTRQSTDPDVQEAPGKGRVAKMRACARSRDIMTVEGHPVCPEEASVVLAVYDALSGPEARHALMSPLRVAKVLEYARRLSAPVQARRAG